MTQLDQSLNDMARNCKEAKDTQRQELEAETEEVRRGTSQPCCDRHQGADS